MSRLPLIAVVVPVVLTLIFQHCHVEGAHIGVRPNPSMEMGTAKQLFNITLPESNSPSGLLWVDAESRTLSYQLPNISDPSTTLVVLDFNSGEELWRLPLSATFPLADAAVVARSTVVLRFIGTNEVRGYDARSGSLVWHVGAAPLHTFTTVTVAHGYIWVNNVSTGENSWTLSSFAAIDPTSGRITKQVKGPDVGSIAAKEERVQEFSPYVIVCAGTGAQDRRVFALNATSGEGPLFNITMAHPIEQFVVGAESERAAYRAPFAMLVSTEGSVEVISALTGKKQWAASPAGDGDSYITPQGEMKGFVYLMLIGGGSNEVVCQYAYHWRTGKQVLNFCAAMIGGLNAKDVSLADGRDVALLAQETNYTLTAWKLS